MIPFVLLVAAQQPPADTPVPRPWKDPGYMKLVWIQSPNFGPRPPGTDVDTVVIHSTVIPTLEKTTEAFCRLSSQVSAHYTIGKDGSIVQHVSSWDRAWHAGVSTDVFGRSNANHFSVGIELVNLNDGKDPYPQAQLDALHAIIVVLKRRFPIKQLTSHEFVAKPVGRKNDPKNFPWDSLKDLGLPLHYGEPKKQ
jgi:N-acetylmuramoyl-L-alanine amidase